MSNVYIGSDDYYFSPISVAQTSYSKNGFSFSLSLLDGPGVLYSDQKSGFHMGAFMTYGDERDSQKYSVLGISRDHSYKTKRFLQDSPTASTSFSSIVVLGYNKRSEHLKRRSAIILQQLIMTRATWRTKIIRDFSTRFPIQSNIHPITE